MDRLKDRFALVTGAGGGLGSAIAELFAVEGAVVAVNDVNEKAAEEVALRCRRFSPESEAVIGDVSDSKSVSDMFAHLERQWGQVDVLVNNAGVSSASDVPDPTRDPVSPLERGIDDITDAHWQRMIGVHLSGTFFCTRAAVPIMKRTGRGSIICM